MTTKELDLRHAIQEGICLTITLKASSSATKDVLVVPIDLVKPKYLLCDDITGMYSVTRLIRISDICSIERSTIALLRCDKNVA